MSVMTRTESPWLSLGISAPTKIPGNCPASKRMSVWEGYGVQTSLGGDAERSDQSGSEGCWRSQPKAETQVPILALNGVRSQHRPKQTHP